MPYEETVRDRLLDAIADCGSSGMISPPTNSPASGAGPLPILPMELTDPVPKHVKTHPQTSASVELESTTLVPRLASCPPDELPPNEPPKQASTGIQVGTAATNDGVEAPSTQPRSSQSVQITALSSMAVVHPHNYSPPTDAGTEYRPDDLPNPVDAKRGREGQYFWYVARKSRIPGIYATW